MRKCFEQNASRWIKMLERYAYFGFGHGLGVDASDIAADVLGDTWERIDKIEEKYLEWKKTAYGSTGKDAFLYGFMRMEVKQKSFALINAPRKKRVMSLNLSGEFEDYDVGGWRPIGVVQPEQEHVLFNKQLMEFCGSLPSDEAMVMNLVMDRATSAEIIGELGISQKDLLNRRARALRRLAEAVR